MWLPTFQKQNEDLYPKMPAAHWCYVTVGMFTWCGLGSAKQWHWVVWSEFWVLSTKSKGELDSFWWQVVNLQKEQVLVVKNNREWVLAGNVTDPSVTLAHKVGPGLQDLQTRARRILAERNAEKAEENTWIGRMVAAESIGELDGLIRSRAA